MMQMKQFDQQQEQKYGKDPVTQYKVKKSKKASPSKKKVKRRVTDPTEGMAARETFSSLGHQG
eukprot:CAMPEP_0206401958 /NCGR_PEP_ID=MMETSP0294-20121207/26636_1 /ASSEMBLY_ACC=CAM_ASM_000327 /TAXON_ID=39354 /ORGANISM="Heterosigma akashiwo, Strain CCMP2393" /LENGTH=62 /DNA_ID=CAMNT_0053858871 /DNA_START=67 /DNA_END=252 /DNA_ORIENTATION=-